MIRPFAILAAAALVIQTPAPMRVPDGVEGTQVLNLSCPPRPEFEPAPTAPLDLSRSGLEFDPLAPGGARPEEQDETMPVPVDPRTVTLLPATRGDQTENPEPEGKDLEQNPDCRA